MLNSSTDTVQLGVSDDGGFVQLGVWDDGVVHLDVGDLTSINILKI